MLFTTEEAIQEHIATNHSEQGFTQPSSCDWQDEQPEEIWQCGEEGMEEELEAQAAGMEENDSVVVMDWTEEGTAPSQQLPAPSVQCPQTFQPRPAYFPSPKPSASPHDFRPAGLSPMVVVEYFCKVCGEILPRLRFCAHISGHFSDIYLPRTNEPARCITSDFIQQNESARRPVRREDCTTCSQSCTAIAELKDTLMSLAEVFSGGEVEL